jgi:serine/threonine protein kinase
MADSSFREPPPGEAVVPAKIGVFRIDRRLGEGASAEVFLATHEVTGQVVALKVLRRELDANVARQVRTRFLLEERIAATIPDPRIVKVYETSKPGEEPYFIAMEYLEAEPFCDFFRRRRKNSSVASQAYLNELCRLSYEVAKAMSAAHARGVVHRDLKPDNVLVSRREAARASQRVKIVDFGIAKAPLGVLAGVAATFTPHHTELGTVMGSPPYMAPEQYGRAHAVSGKADVFALGVMLTICAVGLDHESLEMNRSCWTLPDDFERALELGPPLPPSLELLLRRMVAESPEDRLDMRDVALELGRLAQPNERIAEAVFAYATRRRIPPRKELLALLSDLEDQADLTEDEADFVQKAPAQLIATDRRWGRYALMTGLMGSSAALFALYLREHNEVREATLRAEAERDRARGAASALKRDLEAEAEHRQILLARATNQEHRIESLDKTQLELKRDARAREGQLSQCRAINDELRECSDQRELCELAASERKNELVRVKAELESVRRDAEAAGRCQRDLEAKNGELNETASRLRLCNDGLRGRPSDPPSGEL